MLLLTVVFPEEVVLDIIGAAVDEFSVEVALDVAVDNPFLVIFTFSVEVTVDVSCDVFSSVTAVDIFGDVSVFIVVGFFVEVATDVAGDVSSLVVVDFSVEVTVDVCCDVFSSFIEADISDDGSVFTITCFSVEAPNNKSFCYH